MTFPQQLQNRFNRLIALTIICTVVLACLWIAFSTQKNTRIIEALRNGQIAKARSALNGYHNWNTLLRIIERSHDQTLTQAALDVQFENWYSKDNDSSYSYPERVDVVRRLLIAGAIPRYEHLLRATEQCKMQTARLFLEANVPVQQVGSDEDTPLANVAYWGDLDLLKEMVLRGADLNKPSTGGWRPVLAAAWLCQTNCVQYLLEQGADVSLTYEEWQGNTQPIWKVIEDRASNGPDYRAIWNLVRRYYPPASSTNSPSV